MVQTTKPNHTTAAVELASYHAPLSQSLTLCLVRLLCSAANCDEVCHTFIQYPASLTLIRSHGQDRHEEAVGWRSQWRPVIDIAAAKAQTEATQSQSTRPTTRCRQSLSPRHPQSHDIPSRSRRSLRPLTRVRPPPPLLSTLLTATAREKNKHNERFLVSCTTAGRLTLPLSHSI